MSDDSARIRMSLAGTVFVIGLAGCAQTPMGPTVQVMPAPGKSFDAFAMDQSTCKSFATQQVQGQSDVANNRAVGAAAIGTLVGAGLGAATGAAFGNAGAGAAIGAGTGVLGGSAVGGSMAQNAQMSIQQQYDNAFAQCMYSKGNQVPGFAPAYAAYPYPAYGPGGTDPALVAAVQRELVRLGYLNSAPDGTDGPRTQAAIRNFERNYGLPLDGAASPALLSRLQSA